MQQAIELNDEERQWLLALCDGPLTQSIADRRVPQRVRESLLDKQLIRWKTGYLDVALLEVTARGMSESERLRLEVAA